MKTIEALWLPDMSGSIAWFWRLGARPGVDGEWGVKAYAARDVAEQACENQRKGFAASVAPPVGELVAVTYQNLPHPERPFGYETGVCEYLPAHLAEGTDGGWDTRPLMERLYPELAAACRRVGIPRLDFNYRNLGLWQGRVVHFDWI